LPAVFVTTNHVEFTERMQVIEERYRRWMAGRLAAVKQSVVYARTGGGTVPTAGDASQSESWVS